MQERRATRDSNNHVNNRALISAYSTRVFKSITEYVAASSLQIWLVVCPVSGSTPSSHACAALLFLLSAVVSSKIKLLYIYKKEGGREGGREGGEGGRESFYQQLYLQNSKIKRRRREGGRGEGGVREGRGRGEGGREGAREQRILQLLVHLSAEDYNYSNCTY